MQNKIILLFLIIFSLFFSKAHSDDQINFDVTEIEILDGGNKIIGKNRGTINITNGINIEADEFEFDKTKNILTATGNIKIEDKVNNNNFSAQNILYLKNKEEINLKGQVEAFINENYRFKSENINVFH